MKLVYPACFYRDAETGRYTVEVPDLPGCVTGGAALADAVFMAEDAASGWILGELEDGNAIPAETPVERIRLDEGGFVSLLTLDIGAYAETRFLESIPGMADSLREASSEPIESCRPYDPEEEW